MNAFMFTPVVAAASISTIATKVGGALLAIIGLILLVSLIGDAKEAGKGQGSGSMGKVITKLLFMIVVIAMAVMLLFFIKDAADGDGNITGGIGGTAQTIGNTLSDTTKDLLGEATGNTTTTP